MATLVGSTRKVGWTRRLLCLALVAVGALLFSSSSPAANIPNEKTVLLFSFFRGNGETGLYLVYFDHYTRPQYYGAVKSTDLKVWEDISPQVRMPSGARHGTVLHVPESVVRSIESLQTRTNNQP